MFIFSIRFCLALSTAVVAFFSAVQTASASCKVKAIFVQPPVDVPERAMLIVGQKYLDIELPRRNLSAELEMPSGALVVAVLPQKPTQPELPVGTPTFQIPETWTNCILLFFHDPANKVFPAKIIPVNTSASDFALGHTLIFNLSSATVTGKFGEEIAMVKPGQSVNVKPPRAGSGDYLVAIDCAYPGDPEPTALCRSTWQHESGARQILFVTPLPEQKIPRIWGVLDRPEESSKKKER